MSAIPLLSIADERADASIAPPEAVSRDESLRGEYLRAALAQVPRLLGAIDRNPYRPTYGCLDRQFWHYRTAAFPSEMYQEGVLPLALIYTHALPGNRWYGDGRVRELAVAALRFSAKSCHRDGSCDDYYPFERALGAAAFSFAAATEASRLLDLHDEELIGWLARRADWLVQHDESGRLTNHQALIALGLARMAKFTGELAYLQAAERKLAAVLAWQSPEGWFEEYGGADPGYQTVTIDCLAKYRQLTGTTRLDEPLRRAVAFARLFLHPDDSYGGEYGSRGTYHFYPHGMELLAGEDPSAAELAEAFLRAMVAGRHGYFDDDRMYAHRLGNLIEAYQVGPACRARPSGEPTASEPLRWSRSASGTYLPHAGLLIHRTDTQHTIISAARGGVFKHFVDDRLATTDAGLIVELADGRVAVSQGHDLSRAIDYRPDGADRTTLTISGPLHFVRAETATPMKQAVFHAGMWAIGRWCRAAVRRVLQRRLITGRKPAPLEHTRRFEFSTDATGKPFVRVIDTIDLTNRRVRIRRMSFGTDHQTAYVAASGVYQHGVLQPWGDLNGYVEELNSQGIVTLVRTLAS